MEVPAVDSAGGLGWCSPIHSFQVVVEVGAACHDQRSYKSDDYGETVLFEHARWYVVRYCRAHFSPSEQRLDSNHENLEVCRAGAPSDNKGDC